MTGMRPDPLDQYAPAPTPPVTADAYIRYSLVRAWAAWSRASIVPEDRQTLELERFARHFTTAALLFALDDERYADASAADLWDQITLGGDAAELVWERLTELGINPDHVRDTAITAWRQRTDQIAKEGAA